MIGASLVGEGRCIMRKWRILLLAILISAAGVLSKAAAHSDSAFENLKGLVGEWESTGQTGPTKAVYTLVAGGKTLMERLEPANEPEMITMYSADGEQISVAHYCNSGNQPQMKTVAISASEQKLSFTVIRVNGLKTPLEGHMTGLTLILVDRDHLIQEWTYLENGKSSTHTIRFTRKAEKPARITPA